MSLLPSSIEAAEFRDEGSAFYRKNKFFQALVCYNKSLCFSDSNEGKSLAFANRSAVYLETKKYQQCLDNIELARKHGYPADKLAKLDAREVKCKQLMEQHRPDPREDPWNFFKLSYPANKKLPFIVDCLELREDSKHGRHIVTNRDLKPGDIIVIEEPYFKHLDWNNWHCYARCSNCLKANMLSLVPCEGQCVNVMFCSEKCAETAAPRHRQYECTKFDLDSKAQRQAHNSGILIQKLLVDSINIAGGIKELQACIEDHESLTVFDIDMTNPDDPQVKKKQLMAFLSLMPKPGQLEEKGKMAVERMARRYWQNLWEDPEDVETLVQTANKLVRIKALNSYDFKSSIFSKEILRWKNVKIGKVVSLIGALFNHSCDPNVNWVGVDDKFVAVVQVPVKAGAQLFVSYEQSYLSCSLRDARRKTLLRNYHFHCDCNACHNDLKVTELQDTDKNFKKPTMSSLVVDPIKDFEKNCKYIEENFKNHPCIETMFSLIDNFYLLDQISQLGSLSQCKKDLGLR